MGCALSTNTATKRKQTGGNAARPNEGNPATPDSNFSSLGEEPSPTPQRRIKKAAPRRGRGRGSSMIGSNPGGDGSSSGGSRSVEGSSGSAGDNTSSRASSHEVDSTGTVRGGGGDGQKQQQQLTDQRNEAKRSKKKNSSPTPVNPLEFSLNNHTSSSSNASRGGSDSQSLAGDNNTNGTQICHPDGKMSTDSTGVKANSSGNNQNQNSSGGGGGTVPSSSQPPPLMEYRNPDGSAPDSHDARGRAFSQPRVGRGTPDVSEVASVSGFTLAAFTTANSSPNNQTPTSTQSNSDEHDLKTLIEKECPGQSGLHSMMKEEEQRKGSFADGPLDTTVAVNTDGSITGVPAPAVDFPLFEEQNGSGGGPLPDGTDNANASSTSTAESSPSLVVGTAPGPLHSYEPADVKKGSNFSLAKEGVMGRVSTTGDAKTSSSLSSVQSGWFTMSQEVQDSFIQMNAHIEALFAYEVAVRKAAMMAAVAGGEGSSIPPPQQGPTLAEMHITAFAADDGDSHVSLIDCPNIELLLTFTMPDQKNKWFDMGALMESLPHKNRRIVAQWFEELGAEIKPVQIGPGSGATKPGGSASGSRAAASTSFGGPKSSLGGAESNHSSIGGGGGKDFLTRTSEEASSSNNTNSVYATREAGVTAGPQQDRITSKTLYFNDKILKQMESRSKRSKRGLGSDRSRGSSVAGSDSASSMDGGVVAGVGQEPQPGGIVGNHLGGGQGLSSRVDSSSTLDEMNFFEQERLQLEAVETRQRRVEDECDEAASNHNNSQRDISLIHS